MRLKTYNIIVIVPIFFLITLIITSIHYNIQKKELTQGLDIEVKALNTAISIFLDKSKKPLNIKKIKSSFNKIISFKRTKQIALLNKKKVIIYTKSNDIKDNSFKYEDIEFESLYKQNNLFLYSYKSFISSNNNLELIITIDASYVKDELTYELYLCISIVLLLTFIGFIISLILTSIIKKGIVDLNEISVSIANGDYSLKKREFKIKEIRDLSDTLDIIKSILKEILFKTKNSILDSELFIDGEYFTKLDTVCENQKITLDNLELRIVVLEHSNKKEFYSCRDMGDKIYCFLGEVVKRESINDYIKASSIARLLKYYLENNIFEINKINEMYRLKSLTVVELDKKNLELTENKVIKGRVVLKDKKIILDKNNYYFFYHDPYKSDIIENYIKKYNHLSIEQLSLDLDNIFDHKGAVLIIKNTTT